MAVPFIPEPEAEEQLRRIVLLLRESIDVLLQVLEQMQLPPQPAPAAESRYRSRLPTCEEEDEDEEDDHQDPPPVASVAGVDGELELPDVVPRAAPRQSRPAPKWPASTFAKYIVQAPPAPASRRRVVESSNTTAMYRLPDGHAPCAAPRTAPSAAPSESRRAYSPKPAPRRRRRPQTAAPKGASPCLSVLPSKWLSGSEEELKTLSKMAEPQLAPTTCDFVEIGNELRRIADNFSQTLQAKDEVDGGPAKLPPSNNFLSMLLPPPVKTSFKGTFFTMVVLTVGWSLLNRSR